MYSFIVFLIFRIYSAGFDIDVNALYPKVELPVSRGTPQIQPLLHWVPNENEILWEQGYQKVYSSIY